VQNLKKKIQRLGSTLSYAFERYVRGLEVDKPPIFIVGCGHSGTSLVLRILGEHSRIYAIPFESKVALSESRLIDPKALAYFDRLAVAHGKRRWVEKTPRHIRQIGKILNSIPQARILLIIRDGRDVACSIKKRKGSLEEGIRRWLGDNVKGQEYWGHPNVFVFKYEDLVADPRAILNSIMSFIDEEVEGDMLTYWKNPKNYYAEKLEKPLTVVGSNHEKYRNWQINQPLFDGRGRWKTELSEEDLGLIYEIAGDKLMDLGYIESLP
jgi:hypothetical protein